MSNKPQSTDIEQCETPLGTFYYVTPDNLRLQELLEKFLESLKAV